MAFKAGGTRMWIIHTAHITNANEISDLYRKWVEENYEYIIEDIIPIPDPNAPSGICSICIIYKAS